MLRVAQRCDVMCCDGVDYVNSGHDSNGGCYVSLMVVLVVGSGVVGAIPLRSQPEVVFGTDFLRIQSDPQASHDPTKTSQVHARTLQAQHEPPTTHLEEGPFPGLDQTKILLEDLQRRPRNYRLSSRHLGKLDPHSSLSLPRLSSSSVPSPTPGAIQQHGSVRQSSTSRRTPQGLEAAVNPIKSTSKFASPPSPSERRATLPDQQEGEPVLYSSPSDIFPHTQDDYDYNYYNYYYMDDFYDESTVQEPILNLTEQKSDQTWIESEVTSQSPVTPSTTSTLTSTSTQITQNIPIQPAQFRTATTSLPTIANESSHYPSTTEKYKDNNSTIVVTPQKKIPDDQVQTHTSPLLQRGSKETSASRTDTRASLQLRSSSSRAQPPLSLSRGRKILPATIKSSSSPVVDTTDPSLVDPVLPELQQTVTTKLPHTKSQTTTETLKHDPQSLPRVNQESTSNNNNSEARKQEPSTDTQHSDQLTPPSSTKARSTRLLPKTQPALNTRTGGRRIKGSHKFVPRQYTGPRVFRYTTPASKAREQGRGTNPKNILRERQGSAPSSSTVMVEVRVQVPKTGDPGNEISPSSPSSASPSSTTVSFLHKSSTNSPILSTTVSPPASPQLPTLSASTYNPLLSSSASGSRMTVPQIGSSLDLKSFVNNTKPKQKDENIKENMPTERSQTEVSDTTLDQKEKNIKENPHQGRRVQAEKSEHQTTSFLLSDPLVVDLTSAASTTTTTTARRDSTFRPDPLLAAPHHRTKATTTPHPPTSTTTTTTTATPTTAGTTSTIPSTTTITGTTSTVTPDIITTFPPSTTFASTFITTSTTPSITTTTSNPSKSSTTNDTKNLREKHATDEADVAHSKSVHSNTGITPDPQTTPINTPSTTMSTTSTAGPELTEVDGLSQGVVEELQVRRGQNRGLDFQTSVVEVTGTVASDSSKNSALKAASASVPNTPSQTTLSEGQSKDQTSLSDPNTGTVIESQTSSLSQQATGAATQALPPVGSPLTQQGVAPQGVSPFGEAPEGLTPFGYAPKGLAPQGVVPKGLHPHGLSPKGSTPKGGANAGLTLVDATVGAGGADANSTVGYVVEEHNLSRFRLEEKTSDGFIIGEYGVVDHTTGDVNGVRYTADSTADPRLIYESLMKFLEL
ncbi:hypothetical protein Pcinc_014776 [Petrolisthes cinctipes]|uniref:Mucin-5AC n=1 Tax=Petrolisthes cinctipes TaxID=88211 RepID=A0AAE1KR36_PETCI|nr:hypothetical protein Pcinc_014776 [Petrolisthes cinctipes]